jgi:uncharacterized protein (TIGR02996 family)
MSETLASLHRAVIASPTDSTVRLVYADALEESGVSSNLARAEFIRAQIASESAESDARRLGALSRQCSRLFEANWLSWWAPVAEAAGLPYPHVAGKRVRDRLGRVGGTGRRRRPANWPYSIAASDTTVDLADYGVSFRFAAGFPEEVRFRGFETREGGPALAHRWGDALPLARLSIMPYVGAAEWERIHGPHLQHLNDLSLDRLTADCAPRVAASPYLARLERLAVNPIGADPQAFRAIVSNPSWKNLRSLCFTGRLAPDNVRDIAAACTLEHLAELELSIGQRRVFGEPLLEAAAAGLLSIIRTFARTVTEPGTTRWTEYGPALETLAAAKWIKQMRELRITLADMSGLLGRIAQRIEERQIGPAEFLPDAAVLALADGVHSDKLERLVLPAALVSPSAHDELIRRMESKVEFQ